MLSNHSQIYVLNKTCLEIDNTFSDGHFNFVIALHSKLLEYSLEYNHVISGARGPSD